jgi:hypothetical protein
MLVLETGRKAEGLTDGHGKKAASPSPLVPVPVPSSQQVLYLRPYHYKAKTQMALNQ